MPDKADRLQQARSARENARRARRLARELPDADQAKAIQFAEELEQKADRLEQEVAASVATSHRSKSSSSKRGRNA